MNAVYHPQPMFSTAADDIDDESDANSVVSGSVSRFAPSVGSSATSYDWEMRTASPVPSVYSMTSSLRAAAYREEYGRGLNANSEVYMLPADDEEFQRLDKQHLMFKEMIGKYPPPLYEVIADDTPGESKTCLDLGCGSGSWVLEFAHDFPHCTVVAVDLVPLQTLNVPPNCRAEVDDINLGLQHFFGDFNVVHARLIASGIRDYRSLVDQIAHTLRPGGLVEFLEFDFVIRGHDKQELRPALDSFGPPWIALWMAHCRRAVAQSGGDPDAARELPRWIAEHGAFEDVVVRQFWFPFSPWIHSSDPDHARQNYIGRVMREDVIEFLKSGRPVLLKSGLDEAFVDDLADRARKELMEARTPGYITVDTLYARKRRA